MKICFVAHNIYPLIVGKNDIESAGGAELQQYLIGKEMKKRGHEITYVSKDYGQENHIVQDGIDIYKTYKTYEGVYGVRFLYPMLYKLWRALVRAKADLYYVRCAGFLPGIVNMFCRVHNRKMVYAGAHDTDFIPSKILLTKQRDKYFYTYGLRNADLIITQSIVQKSNVEKNFNRNSQVIRNFYPYRHQKRLGSDRSNILWVSTLRSWKRPMQFVRLSASFPMFRTIRISGIPSLHPCV